jgi:DNA-binding beta-propeller fold protein YncE
MHGLAYDATHDEVVVPVALGAAVLTFRGGAAGSEAPIRTIQGPKTHLVRPHTLTVDEKNDEIIVADTSSRSLLVFSRDADGDIPPKRIIAGPKTGLLFIVGVAVDPVHDRIVAASVSSVRGGKTGLFIFGRTEDGDVTPVGLIAGPHTGIVRPWQLAIDPALGRVFVAAINNENHPPYALEMPRKDLPPDTDLPSPWKTGAPGFVGMWNISDTGDIPPRGIIEGPDTYLVHPAGVAINPRTAEVFVTDGVRNGLFTFLAPGFFSKETNASSYAVPPPDWSGVQ